MGVGVGDDRERGGGKAGWTKFEKRGELGNIGGGGVSSQNRGG